MLIIPIQDRVAKSTTLIVVLDKANTDRMVTADPITLHSWSQGGFLPTIEYPENLELIIAYEEEVSKVIDLAYRGKHDDLLKYLGRGYQFIAGKDGVVSTTGNHLKKEQ